MSNPAKCKRNKFGGLLVCVKSTLPQPCLRGSCMCNARMAQTSGYCRNPSAISKVHLERNVSNVFWKWAGTNGVSVSANKRIEFYYSISIAGGLCCVYPVAIVYGGNLTKTTKHTTTPNRCKLICLLDITMQTRGLHFVFFAAGGGLLFCFRKLLSAIVSFGEIKKVLIPIEFGFPRTANRSTSATPTQNTFRGKNPGKTSCG